MIYVGTETGLHVSLDDGVTWRRWRSNFPVTPVYDLKVEGTDLVIATHGRAFWIVDDLTPLHREAAARAGGDGGTGVEAAIGTRTGMARQRGAGVETGDDAEVGRDREGGAAAAAPTDTDASACLLYTSPSPRDGLLSRMPSSA